MRAASPGGQQCFCLPQQHSPANWDLQGTASSVCITGILRLRLASIASPKSTHQPTALLPSFPHLSPPPTSLLPPDPADQAECNALQPFLCAQGEHSAARCWSCTAPPCRAQAVPKPTDCSWLKAPIRGAYTAAKKEATGVLEPALSAS